MRRRASCGRRFCQTFEQVQHIIGRLVVPAESDGTDAAGMRRLAFRLTVAVPAGICKLQSASRLGWNEPWAEARQSDSQVLDGGYTGQRARLAQTLFWKSGQN